MDTREGEGTVLAFDFGERRIGVAMGATLIGVAHPLETIAGERTDLRFAAIGRLVEAWRPTLLLVGRPLHADGTEHGLTRRARRFANQLRGRFALPVTEVDERYSSLEADALLDAAGVSGRAAKARRDAVAAQVILQSWFDGHAARP